MYYVRTSGDGLRRLGNRSFKGELTKPRTSPRPTPGFRPSATTETSVATELVGRGFTLRNGDLLKNRLPRIKIRYRISTKRYVGVLLQL